jgi:FlaG/FlaF family flagellin (archaellin)
MYRKSIAITAVLAASILAVVAITTPMAFADESETKTKTKTKTKKRWKW